jgi:hypothetical protein
MVNVHGIQQLKVVDYGYVQMIQKLLIKIVNYHPQNALQMVKHVFH